ncbi:hypothetical protein BX070DRAFT_224060 [Coemansia spiralis]|nr:hypothetical protein BX070DRAFT_224060 [Coemansia spiralis]
MHSDEEDSPPKTLAERIARLGLDNETAARPLSRNSISGATNSRSAESIFPPAAQGKPPIAPKPKFGVKPNQESTPRAQHGATPPTNGHMKQDRPIARAQQTVQSLPLNNQSDALGIRSTGQGTEPGRSTDNEAPAISIKDRIRNLRQVQSSTTSLVVDPNTSAICNPFASPELTNEGNAGASDAGADEHQLFPLSPLPPPAQAFDGYAVDSTRSTSLPPLPPPLSQLSSNVQTPLDLHSNGSEALPRPYAKRASRVPLPPPPPPPPALHRPTSMLALKMHDERHTHDAALAADDSHRSLRPRPPPKPTGVANLKYPTFNNNFSGMALPSNDFGYSAGARGGSLPPPPPPPQSKSHQSPLLASSQTNSPGIARRATLITSPLYRSSLPLPPPPPPPAQPPNSLLTQVEAQIQGQPGYEQPLSSTHTALVAPTPAILSRQSSVIKHGSISISSSSGITGHSARTALDFSNDLSLRPALLSYRFSNRRPPSLGVQPFLSLDSSNTSVLSCLGGIYSVIVHQSRVMCTRVDTGEMCAIHNAPGPDERFTSIAPVRSADDPFAECARVWACTSTGRIVVLNSFNTGAYQENLQSSSRAAILCMFSSGIGEIWTLHDDGIFEVWRDRSVDGNHDQPLVPIRKFSITNELQMARRMANQKSTLLLYRRELWFASSRCIWVYDTHRYAEPLASVSGSTLLSAPSGQAQSIGTPMMVAQLSLTSHDSSVTCMASNVEYLDESYISIRGFVFSGTDAGHIIVWKASTYERWRTIDMSKGEADVRITSLACVSDRWLWVGYSSGKISIVDIGPDTQSAAVVSCPLKLGYQDNYAVAQRRDSSWIIAKEWAAAESAVLSLHVDWSPLLTERRKLQVASVHSNGSVFYWDGSLAMDCQYNELRCRTLEYVRMRDITVQINSWNIDAIKPDSLEKSNEDKGFLREWLGASGIQQGPEIIVVGLQEVVDLESKKMTAKSLWMNTTSKHKQKGKSGTKPSADISKRYGLWRAALEKKLTREMTYTTPYRTVECQNMVGLFICIFARDDIYRSVREVDVSHVKTGMGGLHGNKGGIGIRLILNDTSFCFINAHLAAGESVRNNAARIEHCTTIVKNVAFSRPKTEYQALSSNGASDQLSASVSAGSGRQSVPPTLDLANVTLDAYVDGGDGQRYLDNAVCFFSGDLNFRLNLSRQQAERYIEANELDSLLQFDQLLPMISPDSHAKSALSGSMGYAALGSTDPTLPAPGRLNRINSLSQIQPTIAKDRSAINRSQAQSSQSSSPYSSGEEDEEDIDAVGTSSFALKMFREMPIQFRPTYKYDPGTDRYDTSEKRRTPAWCDRVLYRGGSGRLHVRPSQASDTQPSQLQQIPEKPVDFDIQGQITPLLYRRLECRQSDHRPIVSAFGVKTKAIDRDSRKQVLENIQYRFETQNIPEMVYFAKVLWLSRHTTSMSRAGELLASRKGNLQEAIKALYQQN